MKDNRKINEKKLKFLETKQYTSKEEIKKEIRKYYYQNENENSKYTYLWVGAKEILRKKFLALNTFIRKKEKDLKSITLALTLRNQKNRDTWMA